MKEKEASLHPLLLKQLKRSNFHIEMLTKERQPEWEDFLNRINRTYYDNEQERYLIERSLEISSHEMTSINQRLEYAQKLAKLGYWYYNQKTEQFSWSNEMFYLTGLEDRNYIPQFTTYIQSIEETFRPAFLELFKKVLEDQETHKIELKFKNASDNKYYWHLIELYPEYDIQKSSSEQAVFAIVLDVTKQKESEEQVKKTHQKMIEFSRQAGMNEVATSVLHNVGNIINTVNVSLSILHRNCLKNYPQKLSAISQMIKDHLDDLPTYLTQDEKGQLIPAYLLELSEKMSLQQPKNETEFQNMMDGLKHIHEMISTQLFFTKPLGVIEEINIAQLIETTIHMALSNHKKDVLLETQYQKTLTIWSDKSKVMQILINLFRNAYESVTLNTTSSRKKITIRVKNDSNTLQIFVRDSGQGIKKEDLHKIFTFGFTTKEKGHGFGLHSSALTAKELGGTLKVQSSGPGKGAMFILSLPIGYQTIQHDEEI